MVFIDFEILAGIRQMSDPCFFVRMGRFRAENEGSWDFLKRFAVRRN